MTPLRSAMPMQPKMSPLQILLLIQLEASPKYGYEMLKMIKDAFDGIWEPRTGTIYPALKSLERRSLVQIQVLNGKGFYHITPIGKEYLQEIGTQQTINMQFSSRFLETLTKWISPELKKTILLNMSSIAGENMNFIGCIIHFLDGNVDKEKSLRILKNLRSILSYRLIELDNKIADLEVETF
jgi:DNA-binding PadR family transcriptional regulator